jgi:hypothetical protein
VLFHLFKFFPTVQRFAVTNAWALLEVLVVLPEEVNSRHLRLGANRREEAVAELRTSVPSVLAFISVSFGTGANLIILFSTQKNRFL